MACRRSTSSRRRRRSSAERSSSSGYHTASASRSQDASPKQRERAGRSGLGRCGQGELRLSRWLPLGGLLELVVEQVLGDGRVPACGGVRQVEDQGQVQRVRSGGQRVVQNAV